MNENIYIDKDSQIIVNLNEYTEFKKYKAEVEKLRSQRFYIGSLNVDMTFKRFWGMSDIRFYSTINSEKEKPILENQVKLHLNSIWPYIESKLKELYSDDSGKLDALAADIEKRRSNWLFKLYELLFGEIRIRK